jgi:hypothetical protein
MNRRQVLGALAAVFCGTVLPEPIRETIRIASLDEVLAFDGADVTWPPIRRGDAWVAIMDWPMQFKTVSRSQIVGIDYEAASITLAEPLYPLEELEVL